ncbi:MAG: PQQ-binding-like beta-propeller repeat protein [Bdellovibrionales bacterium]|nr:PQQ-binding-like beta-propeller repeat protein [Bdellovibrionales bacterium]
MDNYSKNKINIPGFIILLLWAGIVVAVANHNHPFASQTSSDEEIMNKKIDIMNKLEPTLFSTSTPKEKTETSRFRFSSDIQVITTQDHKSGSLRPYESFFFEHKDNILNIINQNLETIKTIKFDHDVTSVSKAKPSLLLVFTENNFLYTLDIQDVESPIKRITKMPYKGIKAYNIDSNNYILTENFELISILPQFLKPQWSKKLNNIPYLIINKENKLLLFTAENNILVLDNADGKTLFEIPYAFEAKSAPLLDTNSIVIENNDNSLVKLNMETQEILWENKSESPLTSVKALKEHNTIIKIANNSQLYAIDSDSGEQLWNRDLEHESFNFIFPVKVTAKEIQSFDLGWRHKGEIFISSCSKIGLCFIDPKNGRVLKIIRDFNNYNIEQYIHEPVWIQEQLSVLALGTEANKEQ